MLVLAYAGPYAWIRHNEAKFGYGGISWIGPVNLLDYKAANVVKRARGTGEREEIARELSAEADRRAGEDAGLDARASARWTLFLEVLREHPGPATITGTRLPPVGMLPGVNGGAQMFMYRQSSEPIGVPYNDSGTSERRKRTPLVKNMMRRVLAMTKEKDGASTRMQPIAWP